MTPIIVLSTGFDTDPFKARRCQDSVANQSVKAEHIYIDAAQDGGTAAENRYNIIKHLDSSTIVCEVDNDDHLATYDAIAKVVYQYNLGAWLTWGQFVYEGYFPGWAKPWPKGAQPRQVDWFATHLKTYRAGLFQQIREADLKKLPKPARGGQQLQEWEWCSRTIDQLIMFPMLEMAGPDRGHFIPDVLLVYSGSGTDPESMSEARRIRAMPPYARLTERPW